MSHAENSAITLDGTVEPQFAAVRDAFFAGFEQGQELGAAVAVYHRGKLVVDLAAGLSNGSSETTYSRNTLPPIFSATKGITALAAIMLADRGQGDLDAPVVDYWPEFAQSGRFWIPVRCLLTHQSGLLGLDEPISLEELLDWYIVTEAFLLRGPIGSRVRNTDTTV